MKNVMYNLILIILAISCFNTDRINNDEEIIKLIEIAQFIGLETSDNIYVIQLNSVENELREYLTGAKTISKSNDFLTISDGISYTKITSTKNNHSISLVAGIITVTKGEHLSITFEEVFERITSPEVKNCWAGGPGALSCSLNQQTTSVNVVCASGYFACCLQGISGKCLPTSQ